MRLILKNFIKINWQILIIEFILISIFIIFKGQFGDFMVDTFREIYIPQQMAQGKIIYRNLFVIYAPLSYLINAFILKSLSFTNFININILSFMGLLTTISIIYFTYNIASKFLGKIYPISICFFILSALALSPNVFNAFLPYSFGILYGILFILLAMFFYLKNKIHLVYLFSSLALLCKYEFILFFPLLLIFTYKQNLKKNLTYFFLPIFIILILLFLLGVKLSDLISLGEITFLISKTFTLKWFYSISGLTFNIKIIPIYLINFIKFVIPVYWYKYQEILIWALPFITLTTIIRFKNINTKEKFLILSTLLISLKVFFATTLQSYGVYFLPFILISLFIVIPKKFRIYLSILLLTWGLIITYFNSQILIKKNMTSPTVVDYIKENTNLADTVVIYPECLALNVLSNRSSDNKFYSLIPLYVEVFKENLIIKRLNLIKPKLIIINNYDTSIYYYKNFGKDYAQKIQNWVEEQYTLEKTIEENKWTYKIYRLN